MPQAMSGEEACTPLRHRLHSSLDRVAPARPTRPPLCQGDHPFKAHLLQRLGRECAALTTPAVENEGPGPVSKPLIPLGMFKVGSDFEEAPRVKARSRNAARSELVRFAHVYEMPTPLPRRVQDRSRLLGCDLANLRARCAYEVGKRLGHCPTMPPCSRGGLRGISRRTIFRAGSKRVAQPACRPSTSPSRTPPAATSPYPRACSERLSNGSRATRVQSTTCPMPRAIPWPVARLQTTTWLGEERLPVSTWS